jgi:hypothetical protein
VQLARDRNFYWERNIIPIWDADGEGGGGGLVMPKRFRTVNSVQSAHCGVRIRKLNEVQENSKLLIEYIYF